MGQNTEKSPGGLKTCSLSDPSEKPSTNAGVKNSEGIIIIIIIISENSLGF